MLPHIVEAMGQIIISREGRCFCQYKLEEFGATSLTSARWGDMNVMALVTEVIEVMDHALGLGIQDMKWLREDSQLTGCILPFDLETIFVKASNVLLPLDAL